MAVFNTKINLPTTGNNNTGGLYGQFANAQSQNMLFTRDMIQQRFKEDEEKWKEMPYIVNGKDGNGTPTTPVVTGSLQPITIGGNNTGGIYGSVLPTTPPTAPIYTPVIGGLDGMPTVKPIDASQYFDGSVVGTVAGGFSGGNKGGVTDEGVIVGGTPNADDVTFDNGGFKGTGAGFDPSPSNSGNSTSTGTGAGTSTGTGTGTGEGTSTTPPLTYAEWYEEQKKIEEQNRLKALKDAEIYKERAAADAQASYAQNMSTYGANAETMAQMGLTGGGYSDYLNAQAYAQKRSDMQAADRNKLAMEQQAESTYADNISRLDGQLFTYQQAEKEYSQGVYNTLWNAVQDENTTYTPESIRAIAEKAGLSEEDISTLTGMLNNTLAKKAENEKQAETEKEEEKATYSAGVKSEAMAQIEANGGMSLEYINSLKAYGLSDADMQEVVKYNQKYTYNSYKSAITGDYTVNTSDIDTAYSDGLLDGTQYNSLKSEWNKSIDTSSFFKYEGGTMSYADAKIAKDNLFKHPWTTDETKNAIEHLFKQVYREDIENQGSYGGAGFGGGGGGAR